MPSKPVVQTDAENLCNKKQGKIANFKEESRILSILKEICMKTVLIRRQKTVLLLDIHKGKIRNIENYNKESKFYILCMFHVSNILHTKTTPIPHTSTTNSYTKINGIAIGFLIATCLFVLVPAIVFAIPSVRVSSIFLFKLFRLSY